MSGVGSAIGAVVGTIIAPGVGTTIGAALGGAADRVASKGKGESTKAAPIVPKPVETYETQQEAVRSQSEANRRRSSFSNTFVASRGMGTGGIGKSFLGQ